MIVDGMVPLTLVLVRAKARRLGDPEKRVDGIGPTS